MNKLMLIFVCAPLLVGSALRAHATDWTDWTCFDECTKRDGGGVKFCMKKCNYSTPNVGDKPRKQTTKDMGCWSKCIDQGKMIDFCDQKCEE